MSSGLVAGTEDHKRGFQRIVYLLIWLVIVPTAMLLAVGILMLVFWQAKLNLIFGILVVTLVGCLVTGGVLVLVFLRREAKLSKLQLDFVSKVSHELRTPLTSIRMFVEMLEDAHERDPEEVKVCFEVLKKETGRLSGRIERLLDWGRMEAGRRIYDHKPDELPEIIDGTLSAFDAARVGRTQDIEVYCEPDLPPVMVDRGALIDALINLLSNAVKYTRDEKHISIRVSADARNVRIAVTDNGIGIPLREHHRIFQKFYRIDDLLSREVEGSGLGLAIVHHVAMAHGGRVELDSAPGKGSTFTMILPRTEAAVEAAQKRSDTAKTEEAES